MNKPSERKIKYMFRDRWSKDVNNAYNMIDYLHQLFAQHKINYFLVSGTLLGWARHQKLIPWDDDIDIMILDKDTQKLESLFDTIITDEYEIFEQYHNHLYKFFSPKNKIINGKNYSFPYIDLFVAHTLDKSISFFKMDFEYDTVYPIKKDKLNKIEVCIPNKPDLILTKIFGPTYMDICVSPRFIHREEKNIKKIHMRHSMKSRRKLVIKIPTADIKRLGLL